MIRNHNTRTVRVVSSVYDIPAFSPSDFFFNATGSCVSNKVGSFFALNPFFSKVYRCDYVRSGLQQNGISLQKGREPTGMLILFVKFM